MITGLVRPDPIATPIMVSLRRSKAQLEPVAFPPSNFEISNLQRTAIILHASRSTGDAIVIGIMSCLLFTFRNWRIALQTLLFLLAISIAEAGHALELDPSPLSPPDTSSPRATLKSFRANMEMAYRAFYESRDVPLPEGTPAQMRGIRCLDTSQLPPASAKRLAAEAAILLNEVLDHVELPPYDKIPDAEAIRTSAEEGPFVYRIPGTEIAIVEIQTGPRKGEFLFSAETVNRAEEFYDRSISMKPQPGAMKGLYALITISPGPMISRTMIENLPNWTMRTVLDQALWKWFGFALIIGFWSLTLFLAYKLTRSRGGDHRYLPRVVLTVAVIGLTLLVRYLFKAQIILLGDLFEFIDYFLIAAMYFLTAFALVNLGKAIAQFIIASRNIDPKKIDAQLISVSFRVIAWSCVVVLLSVGAHRLGVPIEAVIGSLGVGGFAAALAARPTLENLIAGITLYLDRPVRVGDFCQFEDIVGTVENIGLRSTRIRKLNGSMVSVPNSQFADFKLENYDDMDYILFREKIGLRLDTSTDQLRFVIAKLREMLYAHPKVNWPRIRLAGFSEHALKIELVAYVDTIDWGVYFAVREDIYMRTLEIIDEAGARLAVPIQLTFLARDGSTDNSRATAAEEQVKAWREAGELPFPDMSEHQREELKRTLDYPPKGSIENAPTEKSDPEPTGIEERTAQ